MNVAINCFWFADSCFRVSSLSIEIKRSNINITQSTTGKKVVNVDIQMIPWYYFTQEVSRGLIPRKREPEKRPTLANLAIRRHRREARTFPRWPPGR